MNDQAEATAHLKLGDSVKIQNGRTKGSVVLCKGCGRHGRYFFSYNLDGLNVVYGGVDFDTADDLAVGSKHLIGITVYVNETNTAPTHKDKEK